VVVVVVGCLGGQGAAEKGRCWAMEGHSLWLVVLHG
jgi:hypothetical protein